MAQAALAQSDVDSSAEPLSLVAPLRGGMVGRVLGRSYRILRRLDEGGMGVVFEAEHLRLHRRVAVKMLSSCHESKPGMLTRFRQEAEAISRIEHPHVVAVLDFDVTEAGEAYLVLELLRGETLEERLNRQSPLPMEEAVEITLQLAAALTATHQAGVVHRDVKPSNVFLSNVPGEPPFVKLLDFGISKDLHSTDASQANVLIGTPEYMAPEQARGQNDVVGVGADQCALAVVAYEMLTGTQPFWHGNVSEVLRRVTGLEVPLASRVAPWLPSTLDEVLERAMAKDPEARFDDVAQFARRLAAAACNVASPSSAPPPSGVRERPPALTSHAPTMPSIAPPASEPRRGEEEDTPAAFVEPSRRISECLERARRALDEGLVSEATAHAEAALRHADENADPVISGLLRFSEPLVARIFMRRIGKPSSRLFPVGGSSCDSLPWSPRAAFLMSRIEDGTTVAEVMDMVPFPPVQALRYLVQLVSCGAVRPG